MPETSPLTGHMAPLDAITAVVSALYYALYRMMPETSPLTGHMAPLDAITAVDQCPVSSSADWRSCIMASHLNSGSADLSLPGIGSQQLPRRGLESELSLPSPLQVILDCVCLFVGMVSWFLILFLSFACFLLLSKSDEKMMETCEQLSDPLSMSCSASVSGDSCRCSGKFHFKTPSVMICAVHRGHAW